MKRNRNKKKAIIKHAKRRMWERMGINLTKAMHDELVRKIAKGEAALVERQSHRVNVYDVDEFRLVYDKQRKLIITILGRTSDYIEPWLREKYMQ